VHQSAGSAITENASEKIAYFNKIGLHYNLVADAIYSVRQTGENPFSKAYLPYIVAGLMSFDMARMMGNDPIGRYDANANGFAAYLEKKLNSIKPLISYIVNMELKALDLNKDGPVIAEAYEQLAADGENSLNYRGGRFPVGASKILHFLNPNAFIIIDSNAARAFKASHNVSFRDSAQPGYSGKKYVECLGLAQAHISQFGLKDFSDLESGTPLCRIYDKLTFITGVQIKNQ
jgi:ankyrin repeat protein